MRLLDGLFVAAAEMTTSYDIKLSQKLDIISLRKALIERGYW